MGVNMQDSIQNMVNKFLKEQDAKRKDRVRSGKFNVSGFGKCFQAQVWDRENVEKEPVDERTLRVFQAGNLFHDFVQDIIKNNEAMDIEVTHETDDIICRADIITDDEVMDIKSQHSMAFWHMKRQLDAGEDIKDIKRPNYLQVAYGAVVHNKEWARLVFISKDDLCISEFTFYNNDEMKKDVLEEVDSLNIYWHNKTKKGIARPRAYGIEKKTGKPNECFKYCSYKDKCQEVHGNLQERHAKGEL